MKKLNIKSFWVIFLGLISAFALRIVDTLQSRSADFERLTKRREITEQTLERLRRLNFGFNIFITIIFTLVLLYFIFRLFGNKKMPAKQGYISFLQVICIIFSVFNILSLLTGNWLAFISLAVNILIVVGCVMQKKYEESADNSEY